MIAKNNLLCFTGITPFNWLLNSQKRLLQNQIYFFNCDSDKINYALNFF